MMYSSDQLVDRNAGRHTPTFWLQQIAIRLARIDEKLDLNMENPSYPLHFVEGIRR